MDSIAVLTKVAKEIASIKTVDDAKKLRDKAEACRVYAKKAAASLDVVNECAQVKLHAERRAGELLAQMEKADNLKKGKARSCTMQPRETLADLGIEKTQSHRWQRIASIPETEFRAKVEEILEAKKELTTAAILKHAKEVAVAATITKESQPRIEGKFACIYADPPWKYGNQATRANTNDNYPTMTVEDICQLQVNGRHVSELAEENAHLHLWTTNGFLFEAKQVIEAWGFTYKSCLVWVKPQMGIGNYWRVSHEFLLFAIRGKLPFADHGQKSWIEASREGHSVKPQVFRSVVEQVSPSPRIELFARLKCLGWESWGNHTEISNGKTE